MYSLLRAARLCNSNIRRGVPLARNTMAANTRNRFYSDPRMQGTPKEFDDKYEKALALCVPYVWPGFMSESTYRAGRLFELKESDVLVSTYVKAGTTWAQQVVYMLATDGDQTLGHLNSAIPFLETVQCFEGDIEAPWSPDSLAVAPWPESKLDFRLIKTHLPYPLAPKGPAKFIHVARDGRDICTSYYHMVEGTKREIKPPPQKYAKSWDDYVKYFMEGKTHNGPYFEYVKDWYRASLESDKILFLTYEGMKKDIVGTCKKINDFCGFGRSDNRIEELTQYMGFDFMKANNTKFDQSHFDIFYESFEFFRKGVVGDRELWTEEQLEAYDREFQQVLGDINPWRDI